MNIVYGNTLVRHTPAKINWFLEIIGRRNDGFHELRTIFQSINLADRLEITIQQRQGWSFQVSGARLPSHEGNLLFSAYQLFRQRTGLSFGVEVRLEKSIPIGGGLGGGSANASIFLLALNQQLGNPLTFAKLLRLASGIGSDCPYFLVGGTAPGLGRGDQCFALEDSPKQTLLLVFPPFPMATKKVYEIYGDSLTRDPSQLTIRPLLSNWSPGEVAPWNELQSIAYQHYTGFERITDELKRVGLESPILSGSGSTLFHPIKSQNHGERIVKKLAELNFHCCLVQTLGRKEYWAFVESHSDGALL